MRYLYLLAWLGLTANSYAQFWEPTGGPNAGQVITGTINSSGEIYLVTYEAMYRSTDDASRWRRLTGIEINAFTPRIPNLLWADTETFFMAMGGALWKSTDQGETWVELLKVGVFHDLTLRTDGAIIVSANDNVLYSTDQGKNWIGMHPPLPQEIIESVFADRYGNVYVDVNKDLYRTYNGIVWQKVEGLPSSVERKSLISARDRMIASVDREVFLSSDSGKSWQLSYQTESAVTSMLLIGDDTVVAMTGEHILHISTDAGRTWAIYSEFSDPFHTPVLFGDQEKLYVVLSDSVYWQDLKHPGPWQTLSISSGKVINLSADPSGRVLAITENIYRGNPWTRLWNFDLLQWGERGLRDFLISDISIDSSGTVCAILDTWFRWSTNFGNTWMQSVKFENENCHIAHGKESIFVLSNTSRISRSIDKGLTFKEVNQGMNDTLLTTIAVSDSAIYVGGVNKFYRSTNDGQTWDEVIFPFISGSGPIRTIECMGRYVIVGIDQTGVYFSSDYGQTWENHSKGFPLLIINDLQMSPSGEIFAATPSGVFAYLSADQIWINVNDNIIDGQVFSLTLGKDGHVYAGTDGDGVWRTTKTYGSWQSSVTTSPSFEHAIHIYPNPASTELKINFNGEAPASYRTTIYNLLGEALLTTTNENVIDVKSLRPGHYFLRITADGFERILPLIIQR